MTSDSLRLREPDTKFADTERKFPCDLMTFDSDSKAKGIQATDWKILSNF